jgi:hypothetical protein
MKQHCKSDALRSSQKRFRAMKALDRQKLYVVNMTRSNIFGWRGQFTPEFVERDLREAVTRVFSAHSL